MQLSQSPESRTYIKMHFQGKTPTWFQEFVIY